MKKLASALMLLAFLVFVAVPVFACDKDKTACAAKSEACAKACTQSAQASCPASKNCPCPHGKMTTAQSNGQSVEVVPAVAKSDDHTQVNLTGESCSGSKNATATGSKTGASCMMDGKGCSHSTATAKLPNGHPALSVAEAMKCEGSMVAFLKVDKMTCGGCVAQVSKAIGTFDGVCAVDVDLKNASATVVFHPEKVKTDELISAVNKAGYVAAMKADCTDDMKALFGNDKEKCMKSCANMCKPKQEADAKSSES